MSGDQLASFDVRSHRSSLGGSVVGGTSTKTKMSTLTKEELQKFFKDKKKEMDKDAESKISRITKGSYKSYKIRKDPEFVEEKTESPKRMEEIDEISYHSGSLEDNENTQDDLPLDFDDTKDQTFDEPEGSIAPTQATEAVERDYVGIVKNIEDEIQARKDLEVKIALMKEKQEQF